jgi:hypothetical protein
MCGFFFAPAIFQAPNTPEKTLIFPLGDTQTPAWMPAAGSCAKLFFY